MKLENLVKIGCMALALVGCLAVGTVWGVFLAVLSGVM